MPTGPAALASRCGASLCVTCARIPAHHEMCRNSEHNDTNNGATEIPETPFLFFEVTPNVTKTTGERPAKSRHPRPAGRIAPGRFSACCPHWPASCATTTLPPPPPTRRSYLVGEFIHLAVVARLKKPSAMTPTTTSYMYMYHHHRPTDPPRCCCCGAGRRERRSEASIVVDCWPGKLPLSF